MTIKESVKQLWRLCFDDNEAFIDLYFRLRYSNKSNVAIQSGDEIISALQMIPYNMTYCGAQISTSYISGACTHPDYRGKGVMRELLSQAFTQMTRKSVVLSTLIPAKPWLFGYYRSMGYAPVFEYSETRVQAKDIQAIEAVSIDSGTGFDKSAYDYMCARMLERSCTVLHDEEDYRVILEDLLLAGGRVYTARADGKVIGFATASPADKLVRISELFADTEAVRNALLQRIATDFNADELTLVSPPEADADARPIGMARIIYAKAILQLYAAANPKAELNIELTDKNLSINNGYYYVVNGKCMSTKKRLPGSHLQLNIQELTQLLFTPYQPYMSLMLN